MPVCEIRRYNPKTGETFVFKNVCIPPRVTTTGREDHFARAYEDAGMILEGMRQRDTMEFEPHTPFEEMPRYSIISVRME